MMTNDKRYGTVVRSTGGAYVVRTDTGDYIECKLRGKMRLSKTSTTNPVAVGDRVQIDTDDGQTHAIVEVVDRRNCIVRRSTNLSKQAHVIAANIDQALLVATLAHPETSTVFIDRFLVSAEAFGVRTIIAFNKTDLYDDETQRELEELESLYTKIGYKTVRLSATKREGIDTLSEILKGKTTVISGNSGVGKSTIINALEPNLNLRTDEISVQNDTGKHTTTFATMHPLSIGGDIIDTPGVRGFGIFDIPHSEVAHYFTEFFNRLSECRYPNCTHTHEPGCAVRMAVEEGEIAVSRYNSYLNILDEDKDEKYRQGYGLRR